MFLDEKCTQSQYKQKKSFKNLKDFIKVVPPGLEPGTT